MSSTLRQQLSTLLASEPDLRLVILYGSLASGKLRAESDIDVALAGERPLTPEHLNVLTGMIAELCGRPVDCVDLSRTSGPLLGEILRTGTVLIDRAPGLLGALYVRFLDWQADMAPTWRDLMAARRARFLEPARG